MITCAMLYALQLHVLAVTACQPFLRHWVSATSAPDCCQVDKALCNRDHGIDKEMPVITVGNMPWRLQVGAFR